MFLPAREMRKGLEKRQSADGYTEYTVPFVWEKNANTQNYNLLLCTHRMVIMIVARAWRAVSGEVLNFTLYSLSV